MPKQIWEVADDKKMRRGLGTTQEFNRSNYDYFAFGSPGHHDDVGVTHGVVGDAATAAPVGFPLNQDKFSYGFLHPQEHWATGRMVMEAYFSTPAESGVGEMELRVDGLRDGLLVGDAAYNVYPATSRVFTSAGANVIDEVKWDLGIISIADYDILSWRIGRLGSSGTDNINSDIHFYLLEVYWYPHVPTA
jgi:hypothetical protein